MSTMPTMPTIPIINANNANKKIEVKYKSCFNIEEAKDPPPTPRNDNHPHPRKARKIRETKNQAPFQGVRHNTIIGVSPYHYASRKKDRERNIAKSRTRNGL